MTKIFETGVKKRIKNRLQFIFIFACLLNIVTILTANDIENYDLITQMYKESDLNGSKVIVPKSSSKQLESLLMSKVDKSYFEIAKIYYFLEKDKLALQYLSEYEKIIASSKINENDYFDLIKLYNRLNFIEGEKRIIELYLYNKKFDRFMIGDYYDKFQEIIAKLKLDRQLIDYGITNLMVLKSLVEATDKFIAYYYANEWSLQEKENLIAYILDIDIKIDDKLALFLKKEAKKEQVIAAYFKSIKDYKDKERYLLYFKLVDSYGDEIIIRNNFEKLVYLIYKGEQSEFENILNAEIDHALLNKDYDVLYKLYEISKLNVNSSVNNRMEMIELLSTKSDYFMYRYIKELSVLENVKTVELAKIIDEFIKKYPDNRHIKKLLLIKYRAVNSYDEKLAILNTILGKSITEELLDLKLGLFMQFDKIEEYEKFLLEIIYNIFPFERYVSILINLLTVDDRKNEIYDVLAKLDDSSFLIKYSAENNIDSDPRLSSQIIAYLFDNGNYAQLIQKKLNYAQYMFLIDNGYVEFLKEASTAYPMEKAFFDAELLKFFYFNNSYSKFDLEMVGLIEKGDDKNLAQKLYVAKYYYFIGDYQKSLDIVEQFFAKYITEREIVELKINNVEKLLGYKEADILKEKYKRILNW